MMTIRYLLPLIMLVGCGPIPVQMQSSKQEQTQRTSQSAEQSADQQSAHPVRGEAGNQFDAGDHHLQHNQFCGIVVCCVSKG